MKIKLDENVPQLVAEALERLGWDVDTSPGEGLRGHSDDDVFAAAQKEGRFLITQDLDFSDLRRFAPGTHFGVMLIRLDRPGLRVLIRRMETIFRTSDALTWDRCFVVVTEGKVRVRRP